MSRFVPKNLHHPIDAFSRTGLTRYGYKLVSYFRATPTSRTTTTLAQAKGPRQRCGADRIHTRTAAHFRSSPARPASRSPSSHEGLPIALLEAMSYRLPVVVSDIPANLEGRDCPPVTIFPPATSTPRIAHTFKNRQWPQRIDYSLGKYDWDNIAMQVRRYMALGQRHIVARILFCVEFVVTYHM